MAATSRISPAVPAISKRGRFLDEKDRNEQDQEGDIADHTLDRDGEQGIRRLHAAIAQGVHEHHHRRWATDRRYRADDDTLQVHADEGIEFHVVTKFAEEGSVGSGDQAEDDDFETDQGKHPSALGIQNRVADTEDLGLLVEAEEYRRVRE